MKRCVALLQRCGWIAGLSASSLIIAAVILLIPRREAQAFPDFAAQTGQPCTACHIGGFGPQLTPFGRAFKIGGYTTGGGSGWQSSIPVSAMAIESFIHTNQDLPADQVPHHFNVNNNVAFDAASLFIAGRVSAHTGGRIQLTYSDIPNAFHVDNTDIRPYTTMFNTFGKDLQVGISVNNNPTVQDPYNSTFAWGFPYIASG